MSNAAVVLAWLLPVLSAGCIAWLGWFVLSNLRSKASANMGPDVTAKAESQRLLPDSPLESNESSGLPVGASMRSQLESMVGIGLGGLWIEYLATAEPALRNRLALSYETLVQKIADTLGEFPPFVSREDLVGNGVLGLLDAIERFEPSRGVPFQTYATPRIRGAMIDAIRESEYIPPPVRAQLRSLHAVRVALTKRHGRQPQDHEIAQELGLSMEELQVLSQRDALLTAGPTLSHYATERLIPSIFDYAALPAGSKASLIRLVDQLAERDRVIIELKYFEGLSFGEIGNVLGLTESRIIQLHGRAISNLRKEVAEVNEPGDDSAVILPPSEA